MFRKLQEVWIDLIIAVVVIGLISAFISMCGCENFLAPPDMTDPIPEMTRYEMEYQAKTFTTGTLEIQLPYPDLIINRVDLKIERADSLLLESYTFTIDEFSDTISVEKGNVYTNMLYERINITCKSKKIIINSKHATKIYIWVQAFDI